MGPGPTAGADMIYTGKQAMLIGGTGGIALGHNTQLFCRQNKNVEGGNKIKRKNLINST